MASAFALIGPVIQFGLAWRNSTSLSELSSASWTIGDPKSLGGTQSAGTCTATNLPRSYEITRPKQRRIGEVMRIIVSWSLLATGADIAFVAAVAHQAST
jgi:hypothetical protein